MPAVVAFVSPLPLVASSVSVSPGIFAVAFCVLIVGSLVQSSIGFGANLVSMPILVQLTPDLVPGAVLSAGLIMNLLMALRERSEIETKSVTSALGGRAIGTAIGVVALGALSDRALQFVVAFAVLLMVVIAANGATPKRTPITMVGAGTVGGFTASTAGIGGPPVALFFRDAAGPRIRSSLSVYFIIGTSFTLLGLVIADRLGTEHIPWIFAMMPAIVIGYLLSGPLLPIVDRGFTKPAVLVLSAAAAIVLLVRLMV